jgi:hypothetical protein
MFLNEGKQFADGAHDHPVQVTLHAVDGAPDSGTAWRLGRLGFCESGVRVHRILQVVVDNRQRQDEVA